MDKRYPDTSVLRHMTLEQLGELNDLYVEKPSTKLPFAHSDVANEIFRRGAEESRLHRKAIRQSVYDNAVNEIHGPVLSPRHASMVLIIPLIVLLLAGIALAVFPSLFSFMSDGDTVVVGRDSGELTLTDDSSEFSSVSEALAGYGLEELCLNWIPIRYSLKSVSLDADGQTDVMLAWYQDEAGEGFSMVVSIFDEDSLDTFTGTFEVDGNEQEIVINGITHYLETNMSSPTVMWEYRNCIVNINGQLTVEEIILMLESIYE